MPSEQRRTSNDEEIDKILAELGVLNKNASQSTKEKRDTVLQTAKPNEGTTKKSSPSSGKPEQIRSNGVAASDDFKIDMDAFEDIKKDREKHTYSTETSKREETLRTKQSLSGRINQKSAQKSSHPSSERKSSLKATKSSNSASQARLSRKETDFSNIPHRESHLKDELEKMAVSSSETGQLTKQLRAGRKLEEITASIPAQQRRQTPHHPSERVKKAAQFAAAAAAEKPQKKSSAVIKWLISLVIVIVLLIVIFGFMIPIVSVEGDSMSPTLEQGDSVLYTGMFYTPEDGDIVVISNNNILQKKIIKRVIATEGQIVDISEDGIVTVDGIAIDESYLSEANVSAGNITYPVTVGEGEVFVLGDNTAHSLDSRYSELGLVQTSEIQGKVLLRFYPFSSFGGVD